MNEIRLGLKIKQLRSEYSLKIGEKFTQEKLANKINISRGYLSDIESGRTKPNEDLLKKIAEACESDYFNLINDDSIGFYLNTNKLQEFRRIKYLSRKGLCQILNLKDANEIGKLERGEIGASPELTEKMAVFFNVSSDFLYNDEKITQCPICGLTYEPFKDEDYQRHKIAHEKHLRNNLEYSDVEIKLLENFHKLNEHGKSKLIEYSCDLIDTPKYIETNNNITELITSTKEGSCDSLNNIYTTIAAHDDNLTMDEKKEVESKILEKLKKRHK